MAISSVLATFSNPLGPPANQVLTFAIPAGTWTSAVWSEMGSSTTFGVGATDKITTGGSHTATFPNKAAAGAFSFMLAATALQLADINAAASSSGVLSASFNYNGAIGFGESISSFTLTLTGTPAVVVVGPTAETTFSPNGYQADIAPFTPFYVASRLLPGVGDGVGYVMTDSVTGGSVALTALYGLYTSQTFDTVSFQAGLEGDGQFIIEHSGDLVNWTALSLTLQKAASYGGSYSSVSLTADGLGGYTFASGGGGVYGLSWYKASFTAAANSWVRLSLRDSASGGDTAQVGVLSYWMEESGVILSAPSYSFSGAPAGTGGFELSGYWTTNPGNPTNRLSPPASDGGLPKTDHPVSMAWMTFVENGHRYTDSDGNFTGDVPHSFTLQQTDCDGFYRYTPNRDIYEVIILAGRLIPCSYETWKAFYLGGYTGNPQFICGAFHGGGFFGGLFGDPSYEWGQVSSPGSPPLPPHPERYLYMQMDTSLPEYKYAPTPFFTAFNGNIFGIGTYLDNSANPRFQFTPFLPIRGSFFADYVQSWLANVGVFQRVPGGWVLLDGAHVTVGDSCGQTETVTSFTLPPSLTTAAQGFLQKVNPLRINSVTVNTAGSTQITNQTIGAYKIYPAIDTEAAHAVGLASLRNTFQRPLLWCEVPDSVTPGDGMIFPPNADVYNGILCLTWIDSSGGLWVAVHLSPLKNVGQGANGWETPQQLYASGEAASAVMFLPTGRLVLIHSTKTEYSDRFGLGDWHDEASSYFGATDVTHLHSAGRGEQQSFIFSDAGGGGGFIYKCQDREGKTFIPWQSTVQAGVRYCVSLRNGNYLAVGTSLATLVVVFFGLGTDGSVPAITDGTVVGLVYTDAGVLVALFWDNVAGGATNQFWAIRSYDKGFTWEKDTDLIPTDQIPALTVAPALVGLGGRALCVWTTDDKPQFAVSEDSGRSWR